LSTVFIVDRSEDERRILESMTDIIVEELNVKSVKIDEDENGLVSFSAKANFKVLGKKLGKSMKAAAQKIEALSSKVLSDMLNGKTFRMDYEDGSIDLTADDLVIARTEKENVKVLNEGTITLGFDTELTDSLVWEGVARDLVRIIQSSRKDMGLEVSDRIELVINGPEIVEKTLEAFKAYIMGETLAVKLDYDQTLDGPIIEAGDLDVIISIKKA
jgi:isoleucyl-tRNA synthetase